MSIRFLTYFVATLPSAPRAEVDRAERAGWVRPYGGTLRRPALRFAARRLNPDDQPVSSWLLEGAKASEALGLWKLVAPGAKTPGEAAHTVRLLTRRAVLQKAWDAFCSLAEREDLAEWDHDTELHCLDTDVREVWFEAGDDDGEAAIIAALRAVKTARRRQAVEEGVQVLAPFLRGDDCAVIAATYRLPAGWRWATEADAPALARWVHQSNACLVRAIGERWGEDAGENTRALALGPNREVVGFAVRDGRVACPLQSNCCDVNNRHSDEAWEWARYPLPRWEVEVEVLETTWEEEMEEALSR